MQLPAKKLTPEGVRGFESHLLRNEYKQSQKQFFFAGYGDYRLEHFYRCNSGEDKIPNRDIDLYE